MPRITEQAKQSGMERVWLTIKRKHPYGITEAEIADATKIHVRTVNNYLNAMREEGKVDKVGKLWIATDYEETRLLSVELSAEEAYTLYLGSRLLVKQHDKRNELAEKALLQLADKLVSNVQIGQEIAQAAHELAQRPLDKEYQSTFKTMVRGYIHRKCVAIRYKPLNGKAFETTLSTYMMEPSAIGYATYVIGYSSLPGKLRAYKLERIELAELMKEEYSIPGDFPGLEILRNSWSIIMGEERVKVVLRFSPKVKERVKETQWHPSQDDEPDAEKPDHLRWWVTVADTMDMIPWIRAWGADCEVLEPKPLREKLMGEVKTMAESYGWFVSSQLSGGKSSTLDDFFGG